MADIYDMMLGDPTEQDRMAAAIRRLRGQQALGTVASFTGDPIMAPWGAAQLQQVPEQAQQLQQMVTPQPSGNPRYLLRGPRVERIESPEVEEARAQRAHGRAIEEQEARTRAALATWRARERHKAQYVSETDWRQISEPLNQAQSLAALIPAIEATEDIAQPWADVTAQQFRNVGLEGLVTLMEPHWKSGKARSLRSALEGIIGELRAGLFGAALTQFEISEFGKANPSLAGLDKATLVDRMKRYAEFIRNKVTARVGGRLPPEGIETPPMLRPDWVPLWTPETAGEDITQPTAIPSGPARGAITQSTAIPSGLAVPGGAGATGLPAGWSAIEVK